MSAHPKAALLAELAEVAKTNDRPWEEFETRHCAHIQWATQSSLSQLLSCIVSSEYEVRRKPRTIQIGDRIIPEPLREEPEDGILYWYPDTQRRGANSFNWRGDNLDREMLVSGLIHLTPEAAQAHLDALLAFTRRDGK